MAQGVQYPFGSLEESLAIMGYLHECNTRFVTTISIINAIIYVGNNIVASGSESATGGGPDHLKKVLGILRDTLIPEDEDEKAKKARRVLDLLEAEVNKGPLKVRPMASSSKQQGRVKLRRKDATTNSR